jgi:hypothetical protein
MNLFGRIKILSVLLGLIYLKNKNFAQTLEKKVAILILSSVIYAENRLS